MPKTHRKRSGKRRHLRDNPVFKRNRKDRRRDAHQALMNHIRTTQPRHYPQPINGLQYKSYKRKMRRMKFREQAAIA